MSSADTGVDIYGGNFRTFRITSDILLWLLGHYKYFLKITSFDKCSQLRVALFFGHHWKYILVELKLEILCEKNHISNRKKKPKP